MGIKDLTEKILEDYNDIFADIVNVLVFKGKQRIKPETLVNTGVHSQYKKRCLTRAGAGCRKILDERKSTDSPVRTGKSDCR